MKDEFQKEEDKLLQYILDIYMKHYWAKDFKPTTNQSTAVEAGLELFVTPVCNQKCSYCYLVKHGDELYPPEIRNKETILKNLKILLNYLVKNNVVLPRLDLFSGEIWGMQFGNQVFDCILEALDQGLKINTIIIPTNSSFISNEKVRNVIDYYFKAFEERGTILKMSASVDGAIVEQENRPYKKDELTAQVKTEDFYKNLFDFYTAHDWGFHPMIDASTIEKQKENYVWWHEQFDKYGFNTINTWYNYTMFLEVRNDSWTDDKIYSYLDWLNFILDYDYENLWKEKYDPVAFCNLFLADRGIKDGTKKVQNIFKEIPNFVPGYCPTFINTNNKKNYSCTCGTLLPVRLGDLAIIPCHRTAYPKLIAGHFDVENNEITGVTASNPYFLFSTIAQGRTLLNKCSSCPINDWCLHGCLGAQLETNNDIFEPIQSVCNLMIAKVIFIYYKLHDFIKKHKLDEDYDISNITIDHVYAELEEKMPEEIEKWKDKVQMILS